MDQLLCPEIVGREREQEALRAAVARAARGAGDGTVLLGEAGAGKSRLLAQTRAWASARGVRVLRGRVLEGGTGAFGPFAEVVTGALRAVGTAEPELRTAAPVLAGATPAPPASLPPAALAEALLRLLAVCARGNGALLLVEDVHWADADTLRVLDYLLANAADHGAGCVLSLRPQGRAHRVARRIVDGRLARLVELAALTGAEVDRMVRACLHVDAVPVGLLDFVRERADGVPFFVEELLAGLVRIGALVRVDHRWHVVERRLQAVVPPTVAESVTDRFTALHPRTRQVVQAAALLGREFEWELLPAVTGLDEEVVLASLREATYAGFLQEGDDGTAGGTRIRFRHALGRDHIAALLLAPERRLLAGRARAALDRRHPDLPRQWADVAAHLAELAGDGRGAARLLVRIAAEQRDRGALGSAAAYLERALDLLAGVPDDPGTAQQILEAREDLAEVHARAGDVDAALGLATPALAERHRRADAPDRILRLELTLGRALLVAGRFAGARAHASRAAVVTVADAAAAAAVLQARIDVAAGDPHRAQERARAAMAGTALPPEARCEAHEVLGQTARLSYLAMADREFSAALALARRHGLRSCEARALAELGTLDLLDTMCTDRLEQARRAAVETGSPATEVAVEFHLAEALVARGRTAEGRAAAERAVRLARRTGSSILAPALLTVARSHAHERETEAMEEALARAAAAAPDDPGVHAGEWGRVRVMLALHEADRDAARRALDRAVDVLRGLPGHHFPHWGLWALLRGLAGDDAEAAEAEAASAPGCGTRFNRALVLVAQAVRLGPADPAAAAAAHAAGVAELTGYVDADWLVHLVGWLVAPAAHRDGWGDPVGDLQTAVRWFAGHDRAPLATACRTLLRDLGGSVPRRGRGESVVPDVLRDTGVSSREVDVLRLLARRLSNRGIAEALVLSPRTVEKHVASLLRKTRAADRQELVRLAASLPGGHEFDG